MEHRISFLLLCRSSLHEFPWFRVASLPQLLVLFGFNNSLNTNTKRSGTSDFILTFEQFTWILSWFLWRLSHNSWFCLASTTRLIQIRNGAEHRISFYFDSPGFVRLLSHSSWFCLASTTHLIQIRSGAERNIGFHSYVCAGAVCMDSPGLLLSHSSRLCLASTTRLIQIRNGAEHRILFLLLNSLHGFSPGFYSFL